MWLYRNWKGKKLIQRGQYSNGQLFLLHKRDVKKQDSFENDEQGDHGDLDNLASFFWPTNNAFIYNDVVITFLKQELVLSSVI